jgi:hypothetical protein
MDVVVTIPCGLFQEWKDEGALPGVPMPPDVEYHYTLRGGAPADVQVGDRVYVVACGKLRGYSPLTRLQKDCEFHLGDCLVREGGAVAVTLLCGTHEPDPTAGTPHPCKIGGFRGFRYRWWGREHEAPFPDWRLP